MIVLSVVFVFGLMVGSFLNVCIWRIPAEEQVVKGRSHCRSCGKQIAAYDNIPLLSWVLLGGKCRKCKAPISWSYPAVELATGLLFAAIAARYAFSSLLYVYWIFGAALIVLTVIDLKEMILPDEITLPGIAFGLIASFFFPEEMHGVVGRWPGVGASLAGAAAGAGVMLLISKAGTVLFRKKLKAIGEEEAMGFGDVKLMAMVGAVLGVWKVLLVGVVLGPLMGAVIGLALKLKTGKDIIPFGPFLAAGTLVAVFFGDSIIAWYARLLGGA